MLYYRLYYLDGAGNIENADWLGAMSDEDAIMQAQALRLNVNCELWDHNRLVAGLAANSTGRLSPSVTRPPGPDQ